MLINFEKIGERTYRATIRFTLDTRRRPGYDKAPNNKE